MNCEETVVKKEEITLEDPLLITPEIEKIEEETINVKHELEEEGIQTEVDPLLIAPDIEKIEDETITVKQELEEEGIKVDPLSATMDQDPLADTVKQEEDVLDIKIELLEA